MQLIQLDIVGLSYSQTQSGAYALVLGELTGNRRLPIIIGNFEAKAIAIALEAEVNPNGPLLTICLQAFARVTKYRFKK